MNVSNPLLNDAINAYKKIFNSPPDIAVFAPGRVNLIGEHVDYNDGVVLPMALPYTTIMCGSISTNINSNISSCTMSGEPVSFKIDSNLTIGEPSWANYIKGTIYQYLDELPKGFSFNAVIASDVPIGAGLSSSAALEVATATFIETLVGITNITVVDKALRCQRAEQDFAKTPCGLMDQYISTLGI
jgi:galactokinase